MDAGSLDIIKKDCLDKAVQKGTVCCWREARAFRLAVGVGLRHKVLALELWCIQLRSPEKILDDVLEIKYAHGDSAWYPLANVGIQAEGLEIS